MSEQSKQLTVLPSKATTNDQVVAISSQELENLQTFATVMSTATVTIPKHLQGQPGDCLAVCMQADIWGMNRFSVAQASHVINGKLAYESKLINAVLSNSGILNGRPTYTAVGDWSKIEGKRSWNPSDEDGLGIKVTATIVGEDEPREHTCYMSSCHTRNSPLWKSNPRIQTSYQAVREWSRLHAPDAILGVNTVDEIDEKPTTTISITDMPEGGASRTEQLAAMLTGDGDDKEEIPTTAKELPPTAEEEPPASDPEPPKAKPPTKSDLMQAVAKSGILDEALNEFLAAKGAIKKDGDGYLDAKAAWARRIVENPKGLAKAVSDWLGEDAEASVDNLDNHRKEERSNA